MKSAASNVKVSKAEKELFALRWIILWQLFLTNDQPPLPFTIMNKSETDSNNLTCSII